MTERTLIIFIAVLGKITTYLIYDIFYDSIERRLEPELFHTYDLAINDI